VVWYEERGIEHLCEAERNDDRTPWTVAMKSNILGWQPESKTLHEFDQFSKAERYLNWHEIPKVKGLTFYKHRGYFVGVGVTI